MALLEKNDSVTTIALQEAGQSPWLDYISRDLIQSGELKSLIEEKGLLGVTSNPSIFQKSIQTPGAGYDKDAQKAFKAGKSTFEVYDQLTIQDIQAACDAFKSVYKKSNGEHGFVSLEVDPGLAYFYEPTVKEARRLWKAVNRKNLMVKVPATPQGAEAIETLIGEGININVTLIFSQKQYNAVMEAYIAGLKAFAKKGGDVSKVHSVASVFVSRIDAAVDKQLEKLAYETSFPGEKSELLELRGKAALANSKLIYQSFKKRFEQKDFQSLVKKGAWIQKLLWASTSTKNPKFSDLLYVENLVGPETVNTLPQNTLDALLDHGEITENTIGQGITQARQSVKALKSHKIDLNQVGEDLQTVGADLFVQSFDSLMTSLEMIGGSVAKLIKKQTPQNFSMKISTELKQNAQVETSTLQADHEGWIERFFNKEAGLWKKEADHQKVINNRLGWQDSSEWMLGKLHELDRLTDEIKKDKIRSVVLLGMGGSSLAPEVMDLICAKQKGIYPKFFILDTTDPTSVLTIEKQIKWHSSLFIVASKSGGTIETLSGYIYFYDKVLKFYKGRKDKVEATGRHFLAITDSGSQLQALGLENKFRRVFINPTDIGGRYSALSYFGLVPAALIGVNVRELIFKTVNFLNLSRNTSAIEANPGFYLGILLGALASGEQDKVTFWTSKKLAPVAAWLEQLIAESTGKEGKGILPIDGERILDTTAYDQDRVFVALTLKGEKDKNLQKAITKVKKEGYPVIEMQWQDSLSIGAEFLRWEIATTIACVVMGVNPFDEPNVKESKDLTGKILNQFKRKKSLPLPKSTLTSSQSKAQGFKKLESIFGCVSSGGYVALLAYIDRNPANAKALQRIREWITNAFQIPVTIGFGPRYLHSIGQLYKGGQRNGLFIEFLQKEAKDVKVPDSFYTFGELKKAQALGDVAALTPKNLPVLTVELPKDTEKGLGDFEKLLKEFLKQFLPG